MYGICFYLIEKLLTYYFNVYVGFPEHGNSKIPTNIILIREFIQILLIAQYQ
jgi:hypothetical protein